MNSLRRYWRKLHRPWPLAIAATLIFAAISAVLISKHLASLQWSQPYYPLFVKGAADRWTAYGGTWEVVNGSMRNDSDERGAKLVTGSPSWKDYSIDADVQLLGAGDAGLIARVSDAEAGVDAYTGYYAGLRTVNNSLILGRVAHFYTQYEPKPMPGGVKPLHWYHLRLTVSGCSITATATARNATHSASISVWDPGCFSSGRIGLRSYSSGGVWRNVVITPVTQRQSPIVSHAEALPPTDPFTRERPLRGSYLQSSPDSVAEANPVPASPAVPINTLRLAPVGRTATATIKGVVVLTKPALYVEDSSGGVEISNPSGPPLKVGDEVEVTGEVEPHSFSSVLKNARIHLLWEGEPLSPFAVTLNQAATGAYDSMFIELEGKLTAKDRGPNDTLVLSLGGQSQAFRAIMNPGRGQALFQKLGLESMLRLRGICTVDPKYTHNLTPFVLLVRSAEDIEIISGPPWWSLRFLIRILIALLILALLGYVVYLRAKHWRLCAVLEERGRLAHEMHDTLAQSFAGIGFQLQAIRNRIPDGAPMLCEQVNMACALVRHSHEEARRSIATLRSDVSLRAGLLAALQECAQRMVGVGSVSVMAAAHGPVTSLPQPIEDTLLRIGQEAIANALRHAQPNRVYIHLFCEKTSVALAIADDGIGFTPETPTLGFGLIGMRKRAEGISAELVLSSAPGRGTRIEVIAPLPVRPTFRAWPTLVSNAVWRNKGNGQRRTDPYSYRR